MRRLMVAIAAAIASVLILGVAFASADAPAVTIEDASNVSYTSAKAKGTVDPKGKTTYCHFEYVSQAQFEQNINNGGGAFDNAAGYPDCDNLPRNGTGAQNVEINLIGLTPGTVYHLRLVAGNEDGESAAVAANTFETDATGKPTVTIDPVTTFTGATAHFSGQINPNAPGSDPFFKVNWHFQCSPGCPGAEGPALGTGNTPQNVEADASGLEPNTDYTVKLIAEGPGGTESAGPVSFKTEAIAPSVLTIPAFVLEGGTSALLGAKIDPQKSPATWWFEWGTSDCSAGSCQETAHLPANSNETQALSVVAVQGTFHVTFRGQTTADLPFNVSAEGLRSALEGLSTIGTGNISVSTVSGSYRITFIGNLAGTEVPAMSAESGTPPLENGKNPAGATVKTLTDGGFYTSELTGLAPGTTYHFLVFAKNDSGEVQGQDLTFKTPVPSEPPASCPNAAFRTGPSAGLPDCRAYENTTPLNLLGSKVEAHPLEGSPDAIATAAENGEAAIWHTFASLPGVDAGGWGDFYLTKRTSSGWSSTLISPPGSLAPWYASSLAFTTPNLDGPLIWQVRNAINPEDPDPTRKGVFYDDVYRREADGSFTWLSRGSDIQAPVPGDFVHFEGASADGRTVFFSSDRRYEPGAPGGLYMRSGQTTTPIKDENGDQIHGAVYPSADGSVSAIDAFGRLYIYKKSLGHAVLVAPAPPFSGSVAAVGFSTDGSKLLLTSSAAITPDDKDSASDIYEYEVSTGDFRRLSGTSPGPGPGNGEADANPLLATPDGSAVYFTSTEQLDGDKGVGGIRNLYIAEGGTIRYAMTLFSSASREEGPTPWRRRLTRDGHKLLFESPERLTAYDNDGYTEIYAYDSTDGIVTCASCRPDGEKPEGDASFGDKWGADSHGDRIFFQSYDAVLPPDENGKIDIYEFTASSNTTSLISTGKSSTHTVLGGNSADGRDVFFTSVDSLTPNDRNVGTPKLFDARIGGGFAEPPPPPAVCEGEGCRGAGSTKQADVAPTTSSFSGTGNAKPKAKKHRKAKKHKHRSHKKHQSKSHRRDVNRDGRTGR